MSSSDHSPPPSPPAAAQQQQQQQQQQHNSYAPTVPSGLRQSHEPGVTPEDERHPGLEGGAQAAGLDGASDERDAPAHGGATQPDAAPPRLSLAGLLPEEHVCGDEDCDHGALSPRAPTISTTRGDDTDTGSERFFWGGRPGSAGSSVRERRGHQPQGSQASGVANPPLMPKWLAQQQQQQAQAGAPQGKKPRRYYLAYYFPFLNWVTQYEWSFLKGDFVAALTMASFYIPMALSYAENLAHVPPINGLYAFAVNPLVYAFLGTSPQMVVGPEAAGSLLVGGVVRASVDGGRSGEDEGEMHARVAGVVTAVAGGIILVAGITRLGFVDSVLSRPFLRGFISAIGVVILADQLIPEMGLAELARQAGVDHESSATKVAFLVQNIGRAHWPTAVVSLVAFTVTMACRQTKLRLQKRRPSVAFIPDRFLIVVLSAVLAYALDWPRYGIKVLGDVRSGTGAPFPVHFPFVPSYMKHVREAMSTSFLVALLGFFESSVAAKSLGAPDVKKGEGIRGVALSPNRELVALGVANLLGGCFMALPAFGGYGRSKVNKQTGGKTPMSSIFLSIITILCVFYLLPWFYYLPKAVLCALVSVVAYTLVEEAPEDIRFFVKIGGYKELALMAVIFLATIFYSLPLGIALGMGISLLEVIRHATKPRIQILGKVPGTASQFENAETSPYLLEFVEGCLIVKIPEPLTFANTGQLRNRLRRVELYGSTAAHPALPRVRADEHNRNIIFDVHGVTGMDGAGAQVLAEIVAGYVDRGVRVFFSRVPGPRTRVHKLFVRSGIVEKVGGLRHFVKGVEEALELALAPEPRGVPAPAEGDAYQDEEETLV